MSARRVCLNLLPPPPTPPAHPPQEPTTCAYVITADTSAACGVKGDPFSPYRDNPGDSFGFVVLGFVLTLFVQYSYAFADHRGWLDPIKARLPDPSSIPGYDAVSRLFGGSGGGYSKGYSMGSGSGASSGTTPITAGAYGSA